MEAFQENTVQPIWQLREDLKYRLSEMQTNCEQSGTEYQFNLDEVIEEVSDSVILSNVSILLCNDGFP